jgi:hypothetical protein
VALEQEPRVLVGDRERKAVRAIPRAERAFDVDGPKVVRCHRRDWDDAWVLALTASAAMPHEAPAHE